MSAAVAQTVTSFFAEGQNQAQALRGIGRGNPLALTVDLTDFDEDTLAAQETWTLEIHQERYPKDAAALISVEGTILDDGDTLTFTLTSAQTNLDLSDLEKWHFWVVIYSIAGTTKTDWLIGWLPIWESNVALIAAPPVAGAYVYTIVPDSGGVEWLKISRIGYPDKYVQLFDSIP